MHISIWQLFVVLIRDLCCPAAWSCEAAQVALSSCLGQAPIAAGLVDLMTIMS